MKAYHSLIIFAILVCSAVLTSVSNYQKAQYAIVKDMSHAATLALQAEQSQWITPDTIKAYRSLLSHDALRKNSVLTYAIDNKSAALSSKRIKWRTYEVQGIANCSMADVFGMSNQRLPFSLVVLAMLWAIGSVFYFRKRQEKLVLAPVGLSSEAIIIAPMQPESFPIIYDEQGDQFLNTQHEALRLTPMQHELMRLFYSNEHHRLEKQTICDALWPKKPDASETLYTLIRRIKPIIEQHTNLTIESERGKAYRLVKK